MKRVLAWLLALCMLFSMMPVTVFAAETETADLEIGSVEDLQKFAKDTQSGNKYSGKTVKLTADIDLSGTYWYYRDAEGNDVADYRIVDFAGTFDGNGKTISNIRLLNEYDSGASVGLCFFRSVTGSVKNLTLDGIDADCVGNASFYGLANSVQNSSVDYGVNNVHVKNADVYIDNDECAADTYSQVAGMVRWSGKHGKNIDSTVTNLKATVTGPAAAGGFSVIVAQNSEFYNCDVTGFTLDIGSVVMGVGGFGGQVQSSSYVQRVFDDCDVTNLDITVGYLDAMVGGFLGNLGGMVNCDDCDVTGKITITSDVENAHVGGFTGDLGWQGDWSSDKLGHTFDSCTADVDITAVNSDVGGFVGMSAIVDDTELDQDEAFAAVFTNCIASGDVTTVNGAAGGFVGSGDRGEYHGCTATGAVNGNIAGGFWGELFSMPAAPANGNTGKGDAFTGVVIENSTASTDVTGTTTAGLVGYVDNNQETYTTPVTFNNNTFEGEMYNASDDAADIKEIEKAAQVGETKYDTLKDAITAANAVEGGATVTLLSDVAVTETLTITGNVTIEGAHTIAWQNTAANMFVVNSGATLILDGSVTVDGGNDWVLDEQLYEQYLNNTSVNGEGSFVKAIVDNVNGTDMYPLTSEKGKEDFGATAHLIKNSGTLNVNAATIKDFFSFKIYNNKDKYAASSGYSVIYGTNNSVTNLNKGAVLEHNASGSGGVIVNNGDCTWDTNINKYTEVNVDGATVQNNFAGSNGGMFKIYRTTLNIKDGLIYNNKATDSNGSVTMLYGAAAILNLSGGKICSNSSIYGYNNGRTAAIYPHASSTLNMTGGTICCNTGFSRGGIYVNYNAGSINISGGSVTDNINVRGDEQKDIYCGETAAKVFTITGGEFTQDVTQWLAPNTGLEQNAEGIYTITKDLYEYNGTAYNTLTEVIAAIAATAAEETAVPTVKVLASHRLDEMVRIQANMVLDLNGKTIYGTSAIANKCVLLAESADITINNGTIDATDTTDSYAVIEQYTGGKLTLDDVELEGVTTAVQATRGTVEVLGGNYSVVEDSDDTNEGNTYVLNCKDSYYKTGEANIIVKGGTFVGFNPADNTAEGEGTDFVADGYLSEADGENYTVTKAVAEIDGKTYTTVQAAINAANAGDTVKLVEDVTLTADDVAYDYSTTGKFAHIYVSADKDIAIDLNGHTIANTECSTSVRYDVIANLGTVKLVDTAAAKGAIVSNNTMGNLKAGGGFAIVNLGTMVIDGVVIDNNTGSYAVATQCTNGSAGKMTIEDAVINGRGAVGVYAGGELTVNGGEFYADIITGNTQDNVIYVSNSTVTVNGGKFDGTALENINAAICADGASTINIDGGEFTGNTYDVQSRATSVVEISDGIFHTALDKKSTATLEVTGGTYDYDPADYCAEGYTSVNNGENYTVTKAIAQNVETGTGYATVQAAINAANAGDTVQLVEDVQESMVTVKGGITLDLNGKTLTSDYIVAFNGNNVIDGDGTQATGVLKVAAENIMLAENNAQVPVYDAANNGYIFTSLKFATDTPEESITSNSFTFNFLPAFNMKVVELLKDGAIDNQVKVVVKVTWVSNGINNIQYFEMSEELIKTVTNTNEGTETKYGQMYQFNVYGIESFTDVNVSTVFVSDLGAFRSSTPKNVK